MWCFNKPNGNVFFIWRKKVARPICDLLKNSVLKTVLKTKTRKSFMSIYNLFVNQDLDCGNIIYGQSNNKGFNERIIFPNMKQFW